MESCFFIALNRFNKKFNSNRELQSLDSSVNDKIINFI
jgi:hypothetical protein